MKMPRQMEIHSVAFTASLLPSFSFLLHEPVLEGKDIDQTNHKYRELKIAGVHYDYLESI